MSIFTLASISPVAKKFPPDVYKRQDYAHEHGIDIPDSIDGWSHEEMEGFVKEHEVPCPTCGKHNFTEIREFNLMFKTFQGVTEDAKNVVYLRPETAQGIFVNFKNVDVYKRQNFYSKSRQLFFHRRKK